MMRFNVGNAQHIGARQEQQDSFAFSDPAGDSAGHGGFLGIVADGMGGMSHGKEASKTAVQSFLASYRAKSREESIPDALARSMMDANRAVLETLNRSSSNDGGTTLAAAVVLDDELYWIAAGDSRIYWLRDHKLTRLTVDHVLAAQLSRDVALGKISLNDAESNPERAALTSYLGQREIALIDRNVKPLLLHENENVILCSDGFYRGASEAEIVSHFDGNPQLACDSLIELVLAKNRNQQDNLTVIAFRASAGEHAWPLARRVALLAAVCVVLVLGAWGYWFAAHRSVPAAPAPQGQETKPTAPTIVSQPTVPLGGASSAPANRTPKTSPTAAKPPNHVPAQSAAGGKTGAKGKKAGDATAAPPAKPPQAPRSAHHPESGGPDASHPSTQPAPDHPSSAPAQAPPDTNGQPDQSAPPIPEAQPPQPEPAPPPPEPHSNFAISLLTPAWDGKAAAAAMNRTGGRCLCDA
jgi:PPM family protein phosphatase